MKKILYVALLLCGYCLASAQPSSFSTNDEYYRKNFQGVVFHLDPMSLDKFDNASYLLFKLQGYDLSPLTTEITIVFSEENVYYIKDVDFAIKDIKSREQGLILSMYKKEWSKILINKWTVKDNYILVKSDTIGIFDSKTKTFQCNGHKLYAKTYDNDFIENIKRNLSKLQPDDEKIYEEVDDNPEFPGGLTALFQYLNANINYPIQARENGIQGQTICKFTINKDGSITDIEIARSSGEPSLDKEAIRVISSMPKWEPGKKMGKVVRVSYTLPVRFRL